MGVPSEALGTDTIITQVLPPPSIRLFVGHCIALLVVLASLIPLVDNGAFTSPDEGVYTAQAEALRYGSWERERAAADVDADGRWSALIDEANDDATSIPYARRPLYPIVLTPFWQVGGVGGGIALSVIGSFIAAVVTSLIARQLDPSAQLWTLWLVGIGSPLLYDAFLIIGHSLAAALSACLTLAVVSALRVYDQVSGLLPRRFWVLATLGCAAAVPLTLLRTEGVLVVFGLAGATALLACSFRHPLGQPSFQYLVLAGALSATGVITYFVNDAWARTITSRFSGSSTTSYSRATDPVAVAWSSLLRPWYPDNRFASASMALIAVVSVAAPLIFRWLPRFRLLATGLLILAACAAVLRFTQDPPGLVSGLLATMPWLVIGILSLDRATVSTRPSRTLLAAAAAIGVAVILTSYAIGGASEWGGRFFHVAIPVIAPVAVLGFLNLRSSLPPLDRRVVVGSIVCVTVCLAGSAVRANAHARTLTREMRQFMAESTRSAGTNLAVVSQVSSTGAQRMLWPIRDDGTDLLTSDGLANLHLLLSDVPPDRDRLVVFSDAPPIAIAAVILGADSEWVIDAELDAPGDLMNAFVISRVLDGSSRRG